MAAHLRAELVGDRGGQVGDLGGVDAPRPRDRRRRTPRSPGRAGCESSTTRSPRRTASRTLWVTKSTVRSVLAPDPLELVVQQVAGHGVERAERLVHEQHVGVLRERPGQRDPLAHAAGQLVRALRRRTRRGAPTSSSSCDALACARPRPTPSQPQRELDVAAGGEPREERGSWNISAALAVHRRRSPAVGRSRPATRLSSVVLPQPDAPSRQTNSPRLHVERDVVERVHGVRRVRRRPSRRRRAGPARGSTARRRASRLTPCDAVSSAGERRCVMALDLRSRRRPQHLVRAASGRRCP